MAEHHLQTNHRINRAKYVTDSTNYSQRLTLESWFNTHLEQTPLNHCQHQQHRQTIDIILLTVSQRTFDQQ